MIEMRNALSVEVTMAMDGEAVDRLVLNCERTRRCSSASLALSTDVRFPKSQFSAVLQNTPHPQT